MAALIIPFKRPEPKPSSEGIPPPLVLRHGDEGDIAWVSLIGTREQLLAWHTAEERHFPVKPKRLAYNDGLAPRVRAIKGGLFTVHWHAGTNEPDLAAKIRAITHRVRNGSSVSAHALAIVFKAMQGWRSSMIGNSDGYDAGLLEPFDKALDAFEQAACAMALYRKPAPPDEPEHAQ